MLLVVQRDLQINVHKEWLNINKNSGCCCTPSNNVGLQQKINQHLRGDLALWKNGLLQSYDWSLTKDKNKMLPSKKSPFKSLALALFFLIFFFLMTEALLPAESRFHSHSRAQRRSIALTQLRRLPFKSSRFHSTFTRHSVLPRCVRGFHLNGQMNVTSE